MDLFEAISRLAVAQSPGKLHPTTTLILEKKTNPNFHRGMLYVVFCEGNMKAVSNKWSYAL